MAAVSLSTIRSRFGTAIGAIAGMTESRNPFGRFGYNPNSVAHLRFACGVMSCNRIDADRQREAQGVFVTTTMGVRFAYRLRPKDQITSYDESFDQAQSVIQAITNRTSAVYANIQIFFDDLGHEITDSGEYMVFTVRFLIYHYLPLI